MTDMTVPRANQASATPPAARGDRYSTACRWWGGLQPSRPDGSPNAHGDRGALARLRRAAAAVDILDEEAVFALHRVLGYGRSRAGETLIHVAVAASVLAHVREHVPARKPARAVGRASVSDRDLESATMKPLRMRRLLQAREPDEVLRQMRRLVALAGGSLDVGALATLILDWLDEDRGERARTLFAYDYYAAAGEALVAVSPAPDTPVA